MPVDPEGQTPHLILGGAKSGKSAYAERLVASYPAPYIYVATAQVFDGEMAHRVQEHRRRRGVSWETVESPFELVKVLGTYLGGHTAVLVDCLTLWLSNLLLRTPDQSLDGEVRGLVDFIQAVDYPLFLVSNEVGGGIVPENALARSFRDLAGSVNQQVAVACRAVTLVIAGLPLRLK
ncbi:MAG TPA: bifunctional adenosylcobinamide kinase/adenosylcobinamide-phosphate guanylyltransferase [Syntrophobacteraceae bacterium]|nr:bifunctional adenosylcobinamide kinase/adenosylcobinamide-phosphate guanylyltransferase [Syntrophobacteraceae bacterium]